MMRKEAVGVIRSTGRILGTMERNKSHCVTIESCQLKSGVTDASLDSMKDKFNRDLGLSRGFLTRMRISRLSTD